MAPVSPLTGHRCRESVKVPLPSWPNRLPPQHSTAPGHDAHEKVWPAATRGPGETGLDWAEPAVSPRAVKPITANV